MRATKTILTFSFFLALNAQAADTTFDMDLPDAVATHTSDSFVSSFQKDSGAKKAPEVVTTYEEPKASPHHIQEEPQGGYSSAFTSYQTKRPSDNEEVVDQSEAWRQGQEKPDSFNLDNLAEAPAEDNKYFAAPKSVSAYINVSDNVKNKAKNKRQAAGRSPASEDVPLPEGIDLDKELNKLDAGSGKSGSSNSEAPVSAKDRKAMIMRTISDNYHDLKTCYSDGLKKNSDMKGKVVMGWAMDPQGRVSGAEVQTSQLNNKSVEKCMVDRLSGWRFPRQAKLQGSKDRMTYTFQFDHEKE